MPAVSPTAWLVRHCTSTLASTTTCRTRVTSSSSADWSPGCSNAREGTTPAASMKSIATLAVEVVDAYRAPLACPTSPGSPTPDRRGPRAEGQEREFAQRQTDRQHSAGAPILDALHRQGRAGKANRYEPRRAEVCRKNGSGSTAACVLFTGIGRSPVLGSGAIQPSTRMLPLTPGGQRSGRTSDRHTLFLYVR